MSNEINDAYELETQAALSERTVEAKAGFTPAPWHACAGDDCAVLLRQGKRAYFPHVHIGPSDHGRRYVGGDGETYEAMPRTIIINSVSAEISADMEMHDANARLIAAAPQMYTALESVASWLPDASDRFERVADEFQRDTGLVRQGRDLAAAAHQDDMDREIAWNEWRVAKAAKVLLMVRSALAAVEGK